MIVPRHLLLPLLALSFYNGLLAFVQQRAIHTIRRSPLCAVSLDSLLYQHGCHNRTIDILESNLPVVVEVCLQKQHTLAYLVRLTPLTVQRLEDGPDAVHHAIDWGQITTIWPCMQHIDYAKACQELERIRNTESALQSLYQSRVGRARVVGSSRGGGGGGGGGLTKKQVATTRVDSPHDQAILRQVVKAGAGLSRIVDSETALMYLQTSSRAVSALALGRDATRGGRFKRWPCMVLESTESYVKIINGGWWVVDQSVKAGTEAKKLVERNTPHTVADERIMSRLECLAMGQTGELELDMRQTLQAMNLSMTPEGARTALVRLGRWSGKEDLSRVQPWPKAVLDAAAWFVQQRGRGEVDESRVDLTRYPCVTIDASKTTFRDDAIGLRPRADTGRPVNPEASKWEVLVHIADVSDIYTPRNNLDTASLEMLTLLRQAAQNRGMSRYDLPLGPLHLLPPILLEAVSLSSALERHNCVTLWAFIDERTGEVIDAGLQRAIISRPVSCSFEEASRLMDRDASDTGCDVSVVRLRALFLKLEQLLTSWGSRRLRSSESARKRESRLSAREMAGRDNWSTLDSDDGSVSFRRTRGHRLVDSSLALYSVVLSSLMRRAGEKLPTPAGAGSAQEGRVSTGPLRRYVDGEAQRQALAVLCGYGEPMTDKERRTIAKRFNDARNALNNLRAVR